MAEKQIKGRVWRFGDDVDTDMIIPARYLAAPEPEQWASHVMEPIAPNFASQLNGNGVIIAGHNFGSGSSREHAAIALKVAGVQAIVARSYSTIFHRNAINNGLPVIECDEAVDAVEEGHEVRIDLEAGVLNDLTTGEEYRFEPLPPFLLDLLLAGGLVPYYNQQEEAAA